MSALAACRQFVSAPTASTATVPVTVQLVANTTFLATQGSNTLTVVSGQPPVRIAFTADGFRSGGSLGPLFDTDAGTAVVYQAGSLGSVADVLQATDAAGHTCRYTAGAASAAGVDWEYALDANGVCALARVQVGAALQFANAGQSASPGQSVQLNPFGGTPPYTLAFDAYGNLSGGSISASGLYTPGPNANLTDTLWATDSAGNRSVLTVAVDDPSVSLPADGQFILRRGDFNGDFIADIAGISLNPEFASIEIVPGGVQIGQPLHVALPNPTTICDVEIGDINGDGIDDILMNIIDTGTGTCATAYPNYLVSYLGSPTGALLIGPYFDFGASVNWLSINGFATVHLSPNSSQASLALAGTSSADCTSPNCDAMMFFRLPFAATGTVYNTDLGRQPFSEVGMLPLPTPPGLGSSLEAVVASGFDRNSQTASIWIGREPGLTGTCFSTDSYQAQQDQIPGLLLGNGPDGGLGQLTRVPLPGLDAAASTRWRCRPSTWMATARRTRSSSRSPSAA